MNAYARLANSRPRWAVAGLALRIARALNRSHYLPLEYPPSARNMPRERNRWLAELIERDEGNYRQSIQTILGYGEELAAIEPHTDIRRDARWANGTIPGLDGAALYAFARSRNPDLYLEIGSGNSTKFVARAIRDGALRTSIVSIDPVPRTEIDDLCQEIIRSPLETVEMGIFDRLQGGDIVFFDGSHRTFLNSDVTVFFLEVLPALPSGVLVGVHDIYLPDDYPGDPAVTERYWNEQYVLGAYLLGGASRIRLVLPSAYVSRTSELSGELEPLWALLPSETEPYGGAFWFETR